MVNGDDRIRSGKDFRVCNGILQAAAPIAARPHCAGMNPCSPSVFDWHKVKVRGSDSVSKRRGGQTVYKEVAVASAPQLRESLRAASKSSVLKGLPVKKRRSVTMALYRIESKKLDDFIKRNLEPSGFNIDVRNAVHRICEFLKNQCFVRQPNIKVIRAVKGGSSGKGTALKNCSDADLVIFLSCFESFQDQRDTRLEVLEEIQKMLEKCSESLAYEISGISITTIRQSSMPPKSMSFEVKSRKTSESVSFDVLPTYDALTAQNNANEAHLKLIEFLNKNVSTDGEFSPCFTELQRKFVKKCCSKVKDLIRLVKYWYNEHVKPRKRELRNGARLPAKYALELLTIYAWEQGNHKENFDMAEGFRTVLELICKYQKLCIYWTDYYNVNNTTLAEFLIKKLRNRRPIILDPADPTGNVASSDGWNVLESEARKCLSMPCVSYIRAWDVQLVKTFEVTVTALNGSSLQLSVNIDNKISEIKRSIQEKWNIPASQQRLVSNGAILNEGITLLDSKIFFNAQIQLLMLNAMEIFVSLDGRSEIIQVSPNDKVSSLKVKVESLKQIRPSQYYLTFQSQPLEDERTLQYYGIKQHSTIIVNLRLRGGRESVGWKQVFNAEGLSARRNMCSVTMDLYHTEPRRLDDFIKRNLEPVGFNADVRQAVHRICEFLKNQCFTRQPNIKVIRAVKGGSSGKGTALKNHSDADLVVFLSCFKSFQDQRDTRLEVLQEIQQMLEKYSASLVYEISDISINSIKQNTIPPKSLSFVLESKKTSESVSFDVLPTYDALNGQHNTNEAHLELIKFESKNKNSGGEFSACFTELQRAFVKAYSSKVKDLIRLLKYWYMQYVKPRTSELRAEAKLPPKYALELLTIHAWEQGSHNDSFDTAEGFRTVLELICRYRELCIYWTDYYNVNNAVLANFLIKKLSEKRPIILDPAVPTGNVASSDGWNVMENEARKCLHMPCVSYVRAWDVQPVKKFRITVTALDGRSLQLNANIYTNISEIKCNIEREWNIPAPQQRLGFNGTIVHDGKTLLDSKIIFDTEIQLLRLFEIIVRSPERNLTIKVLENDKVSSLKDKIESLAQSQYYLTFKSQPLEDERTLQYYGIEQHSTIIANLRLRGGSEIQLFNAEDRKRFQFIGVRVSARGPPPGYFWRRVTALGWSGVGDAADLTARRLPVPRLPPSRVTEPGFLRTRGSLVMSRVLWTQTSTTPLPPELPPACCFLFASDQLSAFHVCSNESAFPVLGFLLTDGRLRNRNSRRKERGSRNQLQLKKTPKLGLLPKSGFGRWNVKKKIMSQHMDLLQTPPRKLDTFIYNYLQPDERFLKQVGETVDKICSFLKEQCSSIKISKTVKGGSLGKGTALKNGSDADLVIFLNHFRCFRDQKRNRAEILSTIREMLERCGDCIGHEIIMSKPKIIPSHSSPRSLNFQFRSRESSDSVEVDVLPAFDALGQLTRNCPNPQVYVDLINTGEPGGEFSTCFTELQRNFVKSRPAKLKGLIRLVKHWYTEFVRRPFKSHLGSGQFLPPKYALELLVIYAWESARKGEDFSTAEGLRTVLELIVQYKDLWVFWTMNYNFDSHIFGKFLEDKLQEQKPMILDPADPTGNVAGNARWDLVASVAENSLRQDCVKNVTSWNVKPVKSISVSVKCVVNSLPVNPFHSIECIKKYIENQTERSMSNYYLEWNDQMLEEASSLSDYGIFYDVTFLLKEHPSWCILL
ncbi:uncharacterized protein LOC127579193 [Pristis pectinata]|uniref:uncharacterized protein LOC127579193 n=1 Tax=Pristis pectinata TaxID=685728 RepID=UPI00223D5CB5|nr:uncharacterized protein LOC127579193 [Pristis pectinata]